MGKCLYFMLAAGICTLALAALENGAAEDFVYNSATKRLQTLLGLSASEVSKDLEAISAEGKSRCEALDLLVFGIQDAVDTKNYTNYMLCTATCPDYAGVLEESEWLLTDAQKEWVTSLSKRNTAGDKGTRIRKNMLTMSRDEWKTLTGAMRRLMNDTIDGQSKFELLMAVHHICAHISPLFAPWHREFGLRYENALREYDSSITTPYWDIPADSYLPYPEDSVIWSDNFFGNTYGTTNEGNFGFWPTPTFGCPEGTDPEELWGLKDGYVFRSVGQDSEHIYDDSDLAYIYTLPNYNSYVTDGSCYGNLHGSVHMFVGGTTSPQGLEQYREATNCEFGINALYDPMFIFYHTFLDSSYAQYRAYGQIEGDVESDWIDSKYTGSDGCPTLSDTALTLTEMKNIDLLSTEYEETFRYAPRSVACESSSDCGNEFMWCSSEYRRCLSKVRKGGRCTGLPSYSCYESTCSNDLCL